MKDNKVSHKFHIPVLGTGFSLDSLIKVSKFGIDSALSLTGDQVIESMREHYSNQYELEYTAIGITDEDSRAKRITAYLNLVKEVSEIEFNKLKGLSFSDKNNELHQTFQMLDEEHPVKKDYKIFMSDTSNEKLEDKLKSSLKQGSIDVNIMTKVNRAHGEDINNKEAMSALRGFAESELESSVVLSAGFDRNLFHYMSTFKNFLPNEEGVIKKHVILKVSDYKSMKGQARMLAMKGIWVSEYRIESGLNCGGHAFGNPAGKLIGPITKEVIENKEQLNKELLEIYHGALKEKNIPLINPEQAKITYQGGLKTNGEMNGFLNKGYDGVGFGTPFLFVPEVTNVSEDTLKVLIKANRKDIVLDKHASPLGVPLWILKGTNGTYLHDKAIEDSNPGVVCTYGHLKSKYGDKLSCKAAKVRIKSELEELKQKANDMTDEAKTYLTEKVLGAQCICKGFGEDAFKKLKLADNYFRKDTTAEIMCPGPSASYFNRTYTLVEMAQHINGIKSLINNTTHTVIEELKVNFEKIENDLLTHQFETNPAKILSQAGKIFEGLQSSIEFYKNEIKTFDLAQQVNILTDLNLYQNKLIKLEQTYF